MVDNKKLGRGLDAIFNSPPGQPQVASFDDMQKKQVVFLNVNDIHPNKLQPRSSFPEDKMEELKKSIKKEGVIQPVLVRRAGTGYELISGERRWRVSKELNMPTVPAIILDADDTKSLQFALIENIQREDLNPMEKAKAFENLITKFKLTQEQVAEMVSMERPTVSNFLRLLELPTEIQDMVSRETLSAGHARTLLGIEPKAKQLELAQRCIMEQLSVRKIENIANKIKKGIVKRSKRTNPQLLELEDGLRKLFGSKVTIKKTRRKGAIIIEFYSETDFQRIYNMLKNAK